MELGSPLTGLHYIHSSVKTHYRIQQPAWGMGLCVWMSKSCTVNCSRTNWKSIEEIDPRSVLRRTNVILHCFFLRRLPFSFSDSVWSAHISNFFISAVLSLPRPSLSVSLSLSDTRKHAQAHTHTLTLSLSFPL